MGTFVRKSATHPFVNNFNFILLFCLLFYLPFSLFGQSDGTAITPDDLSDAELFELFFGEEAASQDVIASYRFYINDEYIENIEIDLSQDETENRISADDIVYYLDNLLEEIYLWEIESSIDSDGMISFADLKRLGLMINLNERELELYLSIPYNLTRESIYSMSESRYSGYGEHIPPSEASGYVNLETRLDIFSNKTSQDLNVSAPFNSSMDLVFNFRGYVFENGYTLQSTTNPSFQFDYLRIVKDFQESMLRFVLGDLTIPVISLQSSMNLRGFGISRNFSLQPYSVFKPLGSMEFELQEAADVNVYLNERKIQSLHLNPGPHNIIDFPFSPGNNEIYLEMVDADGDIQSFTSLFPFDSQLLKQNESEFAIGFGYPPINSTEVNISGFFRIGISRWYTVGAYYQGTTTLQLFGIENGFASRIGNFGTDFAFSSGRGTGADFASSITYNYFFRKSRWIKNISLIATYKDRFFSGPQTVTVVNLYPWDISLNSYQSLPFDIGLNSKIRFRSQHTKPTNIYSLSFFLSKNINSNISTAFTLDMNFQKGEIADMQGTFRISIREIEKNQSISVEHEALGQSANIDYQKSYSTSKGKLSLNSSLAGLPVNNDEKTRLSVGTTYKGNRINSSFTHKYEMIDDTNTSNKSSLSIETALAFAGRYSGISTPIQDSFAIVKPIKNLSNEIVGINPQGDGYASVTDKFGNPVLSNLKSYKYSRIQIDSPSVQVGVDIGETSYLVKPTYKSGTSISVGTDKAVTVKGQLFYSDGTPVALQAFEVRDLFAGLDEPQLFFSDENGRFMMYGITLSEYIISIFLNNKMQVGISIDPTQVEDLEILDLGDIVIVDVTEE
jgi:outer membrane usher protein